MAEKKTGRKTRRCCDFCKTSAEDSPLIEGKGSPINVEEMLSLSKLSRDEAKRIAARSVYICEKCASDAHKILVQNRLSRKRTGPINSYDMPTPREIVEFLDQRVIGQEQVKRSLAVAVYNHYKRIVRPTFSCPEHLNDVRLSKSNVLIIGRTGVGKTYTCEMLAELLDVPFAIGDATTLTEAGYVGEDVENLLLKLLHAADFDIKLAERGIIYIDEIDKKGKTSQNVSITRDVSGEGVQQALLKILEGTIANVPPQGGRKHPEQQYLQIDTSNILFICGGAFVGLEDIIARRIGKKQIGFNTAVDTEIERNKLLSQVTFEDLQEYGMIPELIGRLPVIAPMRELTEDDLVRILTDPRDALFKQYQLLFHLEGAEIEFTPEAAVEIARKAKAKGTGARALRSVMESVMTDLMFNLPDEIKKGNKKFLITPEIVGSLDAVTAKEAA